MKKNSLVKYIGGQDKIGFELCPLYKDSIYTVSDTCKGKFHDGWNDAIFLVETGQNYAFRASMFEEIEREKLGIVDISKLFEKKLKSIQYDNDRENS